MSMLDILKYPDPRLKQKSVSVEQVTEELKTFAEDMLETMYASGGIGLAAPQVDKRINLIVIDTRFRDENGEIQKEHLTPLEAQVEFPLVLFNPEIQVKKGETSFQEGCLSLPGYVELVDRAEYVEVTALNKNGEPFTIKTDGLLAICLQHEMDHLEGKLFIDRISFMKSDRLKKKIKKLGYPEIPIKDREDRSQVYFNQLRSESNE